MAREHKGALEQIATAVDLVAIEGPGEGIHAELDPEVPLLIGRGLRGLEIPDPHVSLQHAIIEWDGKQYTLTDLDSATGTVLEGEKIPANATRGLVVGNRFKVGGTVFEVVERHGRWRRMAEIGALAAMALVLLGAVLWVLAPNTESEITLVWGSEIHQGPIAHRQLALDPSYLRTWGIDPYAIRIRRVTDVDEDGVDEVWFLTGPRQFVVTFDAEGHWVHLGELPPQCSDIKNSAIGGLPQLECGRVTWAALDGQPYTPVDQRGVVVWGPPVEAWDKPGPPPPALAQPRWASLRRETALAGFLAANGIGQPVAYLVCEHVFPGVPGLVRTAHGEVHPLSIECRDTVSIKGGDLASIMAISFSSAGRDALLADLSVHLSGSADGLFLAPETRATHAAWEGTPVDSGNPLVNFDSPDHFFEPIPAEAPLTQVARWPSEEPDLPLAKTVKVVGTGTVTVDVPGCSELEVTTESWRCQMAQGCMSGSTFISVRDIGCGDPSEVLSATYSGGRFKGTTQGLEVLVYVEVAESSERLDVIRTRLGWRKATGG